MTTTIGLPTNTYQGLGKILRLKILSNLCQQDLVISFLNSKQKTLKKKLDSEQDYVLVKKDIIFLSQFIFLNCRKTLGGIIQRSTILQLSLPAFKDVKILPFG